MRKILLFLTLLVGVVLGSDTLMAVSLSDFRIGQSGEPAKAVEESVRKPIEVFFAKLKQKDVNGAYDQLAKGTFIAERAEELNQLKEKTRQAIELFGEMQGFEIVQVKAVGEHLVGVNCVSLGKKFPLRWRFYFYKSEDNWRLIDIRVDDRLALMFGEGAEKASGQD